MVNNSEYQYGFENNYGASAPQDQQSTTQPQESYGFENNYSTSSKNPATKWDVIKAAAGPISDVLQTPWGKVQQGFKQAGGAIAEGGGYLGGRIGYPQTGQALGVGIGGTIALAPELLATYTGLKGIYESQNPVVKGLVNTPQELGPQYEAQNEAIGISNKVPETASKVQYENPQQYPSQLSNIRYKQNPPIAGIPVEPTPIATGAKMPTPKPVIPAEPLASTVPLKYPNDPGSLINLADSRIATHGENLTPQELSDYKKILDTMIDNGTIPKFGENGKITPLYARASQLRNTIVSLGNKLAEPLLQNANVPEGIMQSRSGLNQAYGIASKQQAVTEASKQAMKYLAELAGAGYGAQKVYDYFKK